MINWLNSYANAVTAFSAAVTALATGALAILTWILAQENRKLRKAGTEPKVVAYPRSDFYDGDPHLNEEMQKIHSQKVATDIVPLLPPSLAGERP